MARACIYTAIYGEYDDLAEQPPQSVPTDFVCFTDGVPRAVPPWAVVRNRRRGHLSPRMRAKFFKVLSHRVFPRGRPAMLETFPFGLRGRRYPYDYVIWIDASIRITRADFAEMMIAEIGQAGMSMIVHPDRDCVYDELDATIAWGKYQAAPVTEQVASYRQEGYPAHRGLMAGGLITRACGDLSVAQINEAWWAEQVRWTDQDQLSLPVVLWRLGREVSVVRIPLWTSGYFGRLPHRFER